MERGKKTSQPGIFRVGKDRLVVRVTTVDPVTGRRIESAKIVPSGSMVDAIAAREQLKKMLTNNEQQEMLSSCQETLLDYAERWLAHLKNTGRNRPHVLKGQTDRLKAFILPQLGMVKLGELSPQRLARWMEELGSLTRVHGQPYATQTLQSAWRTLRAMLKDAVVLAGLPSDITVGVRFHAKGVSAKPKDVLTQPEMKAVLEAAQHESPDIRAMLWVGFSTGMRFGELSALTWDDVDFKAREIRVARSQVHGNVGPTKTATFRTVPVHDSLVEVLRAHQAWQQARPVRCVVPGMVFPASNGEFRIPTVLIKPLRRCCAHAGIAKNVTAHTMRRTFNNLVRLAAGEVAARAMTGHATQAMTVHYSHVSLTEKHSAQRAALGDLGAGAPNGGTTGGTKPEIGGTSGLEVV